MTKDIRPVDGSRYYFGILDTAAFSGTLVKYRRDSDLVRVEDGDLQIFKITAGGKKFCHLIFHRGEWFETLEDAVLRLATRGRFG